MFQYADVIVNNSQYYYDSNGLTNYTSNAQFINGKLITDSSAVKYKFAFNDDKTINYVNIKVTNATEFGTSASYTINYELNTNNTIAKRIIKTGRRNNALYTDVLKYDADKRYIGFDRYDSKSNQLLYTVTYSFFSIEDLPPTDN